MPGVQTAMGSSHWVTRALMPPISSAARAGIHLVVAHFDDVHLEFGDDGLGTVQGTGDAEVGAGPRGISYREAVLTKARGCSRSELPWVSGRALICYPARGC
jgi:hypothetical protein